jgi:hypothetical protein
MYTDVGERGAALSISPPSGFNRPAMLAPAAPKIMPSAAPAKRRIAVLVKPLLTRNKVGEPLRRHDDFVAFAKSNQIFTDLRIPPIGVRDV